MCLSSSRSPIREVALPKQDLVIAESLGLRLRFQFIHKNQALAKILS